MEKKNTNPAALYSEAQQQRDIEALNLAAENTVSNFGAAIALARRYGYPEIATANLYTMTDELVKEYFLLANYIHDPAAADIVDTLAAKHVALEGKLATAAGDTADKPQVDAAIEDEEFIDFAF